MAAGMLAILGVGGQRLRRQWIYVVGAKCTTALDESGVTSSSTTRTFKIFKTSLLFVQTFLRGVAASHLCRAVCLWLTNLPLSRLSLRSSRRHGSHHLRHGQDSIRKGRRPYLCLSTARCVARHPAGHAPGLQVSHSLDRSWTSSASSPQTPATAEG